MACRSSPAWNALYGDEHRRRVSLPTYPFERKRYWSDILKSGNKSDENEIAPNVAASAKKFDPPSSGLEEKETVNTVVSVPEPVSTPADGSNRGTHILAALTEIINDLSGIEIAKVDSSASFLEMGFDSLFLTQFTVAVQKKFGVKTTFENCWVTSPLWTRLLFTSTARLRRKLLLRQFRRPRRYRGLRHHQSRTRMRMSSACERWKKADTVRPLPLL